MWFGIFLFAISLTLLILIELDKISFTRWVSIGLLSWIFIGSLLTAISNLF
jgi:hypothetical protein